MRPMQIAGTAAAVLLTATVIGEAVVIAQMSNKLDQVSERTLVPGPRGPQGPAGPAGPQGPPGADGTDGQDGQDFRPVGRLCERSPFAQEVVTDVRINRYNEYNPLTVETTNIYPCAGF
jgi:hypothetical protein